MTKLIRIPALLMAALVAASVPALAYDSSLLDDANAHLVKTRALVNAASEGSVMPKAYDRHTKRAVQLINKAMQEIDQAKAAAAMPLGPHHSH